MIWLYPADGPPAELIAFAGEPPLEFLQQAVQGFIEVVPLPGFGQMVINEEGKLRGMPLNVWATQLFRTHHPDLDDWIAGPAVVLSEGNRLT